MLTRPIRIGFFGTPVFAATVLRDILGDRDVSVACVVTSPDKPVGRSSAPVASPVKQVAQQAKIPVLTPEKIRGNEVFLEMLRSYDCDYFVVVAYGKILPQILLDIPHKLSINVHGSILPKYRGASPIPAVLLAWESETGVTIMQMSAGMDEGDILHREKIPIDPHETTQTLFEKFGEISGKVLLSTLKNHYHWRIMSSPQDHAQATYCGKIEKTDGCIDWSKEAISIYRAWQAYTPWPGIYTWYQWKRCILENPRPMYLASSEKEVCEALKPFVEVRQDGGEVGEEYGEVGEVIQTATGDIAVVCWKGLLVLETIKIEWKRAQNIQDFIRGNPTFISSKFSYGEHL